MPQVQSHELSQMGSQGSGQIDSLSDICLPFNSIHMNAQEEQSLMNDVSRELGNYSSDQLKSLYSELTSYDPNLAGCTYYADVNLVGIINNVSHQLFNDFFFLISSNFTKIKRLYILISSHRFK